MKYQDKRLADTQENRKFTALFLKKVFRKLTLWKKLYTSSVFETFPG